LGPRCACDVPSHNYTWSFEPKLDWSGVYATSQEIYNYFDSFSNKYGLKKYIHTEHQVIGAQWDNKKGGYDVRVQYVNGKQEFTAHCDILINASGVLNNWRWPAIPGLDKYKGLLLHTANWDPKTDLTGKHVGLIGNG
jgi:cation diffusion facilitator CzcD-associated flavoprotein CzcO